MEAFKKKKGQCTAPIVQEFIDTLLKVNDQGILEIHEFVKRTLQNLNSE